MKVTRIQIKTDTDNDVHFDSGHNEYTLCGLDTMGDPTLKISEPVITNKKVDCPQCIRIVKFCMRIKPNEWKE